MDAQTFLRTREHLRIALSHFDKADRMTLTPAEDEMLQMLLALHDAIEEMLPSYASFSVRELREAAN